MGRRPMRVLELRSIDSVVLSLNLSLVFCRARRWRWRGWTWEGRRLGRRVRLIWIVPCRRVLLRGCVAIMLLRRLLLIIEPIRNLRFSARRTRWERRFGIEVLIRLSLIISDSPCGRVKLRRWLLDRRRRRRRRKRWSGRVWDDVVGRDGRRRLKPWVYPSWSSSRICLPLWLRWPWSVL